VRSGDVLELLDARTPLELRVLHQARHSRDVDRPDVDLVVGCLLAVFARGQRIRVTEACLELPSRLERNIVEAQDLVPGLALIDGRQQLRVAASSEGAASARRVVGVCCLYTSL